MPLSLCNKNLTPLQRRSMQRMSAVLMLTVLTNLSTPGLHNPLLDLVPGLQQLLAPQGHSSVFLTGLLAGLAVLPVLLAVWVAARYLAAEPDEFIRTLVVRALLWGFAVTMAGNAVAGVFINIYSRPFPLSLLNADLFFASTLIAFRLLQWSYR
jgi:hypothetical protein